MKVKVIEVKFVPSTTLVKTKLYNEQMAELADLRGQVDTLNAALESAYQYQEELFQEARNLRLAEARAMSDKKKAEDDFYTMKKNYADVCADRDNLEAAYKQLQRAFANCTRQTNEEYKELSDECYDLRNELRDREARIDELEHRIQWLEHEEAFWHKAAEENAELAHNEIQTVSLREQQIVDMGHKIDELQEYIAALKDEAAIHKEEKEAFEAALQGFEETRKEYEAEIVRVCQQKRDLHQKLAEAQKCANMNHQLQADSTDKISSQTAIITIYKNTLAERDATIEQLQKDLDNCRKQLVEANKTHQVPAKFNSVWDVLVSSGLIKEEENNG